MNHHHILQCHIYRSSNPQGELPSPSDPCVVRLIRLTKPLTDTPETILKCLGESVSTANNNNDISSSSSSSDSFLQPIAEYLDQANLHYITFMSSSSPNSGNYSKNINDNNKNSSLSPSKSGGGGVNAALKNKLKSVNDLLNREKEASPGSPHSKTNPNQAVKNPTTHEQLLQVLASQGKKNLVTVSVYPAFSDGSCDLSSVSDEDYDGPLKLKEPLLEQLETRSGLPMVPGSPVATSAATKISSSSSSLLQHQHQHSPTRSLKIGSMVIPLAIVMVVDSVLEANKNKKKKIAADPSLKLNLKQPQQNTGTSHDDEGDEKRSSQQLQVKQQIRKSSSEMSGSSPSSGLVTSPTKELRIGRANSVFLKIEDDDNDHYQQYNTNNNNNNKKKSNRKASVDSNATSLPHKIQTSNLVDGVDPLDFADDDGNDEGGENSANSSSSSPSRRLELIVGEEQIIKPVTSFTSDAFFEDDGSEKQSSLSSSNQHPFSFLTRSSSSTRGGGATLPMSPARKARLDQQRRENIARIERKREEEERKRREKAALYERERQEKLRLEKDIKHQATLAQKRQQMREAEIERKKKSYTSREQELANEKSEFSRRLEEYKTLAQIASLRSHQEEKQKSDQQKLLMTTANNLVGGNNNNTMKTTSSSSGTFFLHQQNTRPTSSGTFTTSNQMGEESQQQQYFLDDGKNIYNHQNNKKKKMSELVEDDLELLVKASVEKSNQGDQNMTDLEMEREKKLKEIQNKRGLNVLLNDLDKKKVESSRVNRKQIIDYQEVLKMLKR